MQHKWRSLHPGEKPPKDKALNWWMNQFKETSTVEKQKSTDRPRTSEEDVEHIRQSCIRSSKKSIARRSVILGIPKTTIQNVLQKRLRPHAYKIQLKQEIKPDDRPKRVEFATFMLNAIDEDETFLQCICFLDEATFYVNGCVNRHNYRIWGTQQPNEFHDCVRGSPKVTSGVGFCMIMLLVPSSSVRKPLLGLSYIDLLEQYVFPKIETFEEEIVSRVTFMQDGAPPHFSCFVTDVLNERFPDAWIGWGGPIPLPP